MLDIATILSKYGDFAELIGALMSGVLVALVGYFTVGGSWKKLKENEDYKGNKYSWKNSIGGLIIFILSIPLVIWVTLHIFGYL